MKKTLSKSKDVKIDYIEIVDADNFMPVMTVKNRVLIAVAVFIGDTRLIDNVIVNV